MNPVLSIAFGFLFLAQAMVPNMDLCCEIQKVPALFKHYQEHVERDGTSFVSFLGIHYGNMEDPGVGRTQDDHSKLPFHGQHDCYHGYVFITPLLGKIHIPTPNFSERKLISRYNFSILSTYPNSPFQPPQV